MAWFSVRCIFRDGGDVYEERVTLWDAEDFDAAIRLAESEAESYVECSDFEYLGLAQAYWLYDEPGSGAEVFSLMRTSELQPREYLDRFFDTGSERQRTV